MAGLTQEQIQALLGKARQRGQYEDKLIQFVNSGEAGINVNEEWATELGDKQASTLKQGFENAKGKANVAEATNGGAANVKVIVSGEGTETDPKQVFLINLGNVEGAVMPEPAEAGVAS